MDEGTLQLLQLLVTSLTAVGLAYIGYLSNRAKASAEQAEKVAVETRNEATRAVITAERQATDIKQETQRVAQTITRNQERDARTIKEALTANTAITRTAAEEAKAAYTEANTINAKIASVGERFDALLMRDYNERRDERNVDRTERAEQIDHIQDVTDEIHEVVVEGAPAGSAEPANQERGRA